MEQEKLQPIDLEVLNALKSNKPTKKEPGTIITYDIDRQQYRKSKKTILEARSKLFLSASTALILALAFYLIFKVEGV
ncbi:hypothetical protein [Helicobacter pylori]|uniref:hypothetical protein n=1 Tax=Helicobacter pylori TaxID=210 RepID=UPI0004137369|nr:hypothetical protein [Helicobacter pylori]